MTFKKWSDPNYVEDMKKRQEERYRIEAEKEALRKITCSVTGHRPGKGKTPEELGGYDMRNPIMLQLKEKLLEVLTVLIEKEGITRFVSGGALGSDQAFFWCVEILKKKYPHITNILAIPFKDQAIRWTPQQQELYEKMLKRADEVIDVSLLPDYDSGEAPTLPLRSYSSKKMDLRNHYLVDHCRVLVAVYGGRKGGTANCLRYANERYLNHMIWTLNPKYNFQDDVRFTL